MTDTLRGKLIQKGWVTEFNATTLVRLIEEHYAELAKPVAVTGQPSDEEIMGLMPQQMHEDLAAAIRAMAAQEGIDSAPAKGVMRIMLNRHVVDLARAVLARWGKTAPVPAADGEVAELEAWLREIGDTIQPSHLAEHQRYKRAAKLLQRQALVPVPVPVSERLPGPEDCDAEHYCWRWNTIGRLWARQPLARSWYEFESHWLPATALPLPGQEVEG